ncbi:hypothetical protein BCR44DRAFT_63048 [Catenaria anguillulae PL171]|uniref:SET domain-containing protein n=1 Tax=Catenaria anguillulae PL171 TaxID=765915 RepID=A0A1Y2HEE1_9FUNG|nr:hypothetical protein BCR44DRAFT_63048 [Catenaria anguillulae PL171]
MTRPEQPTLTSSGHSHVSAAALHSLSGHRRPSTLKSQDAADDLDRELFAFAFAFGGSRSWDPTDTDDPRSPPAHLGAIHRRRPRSLAALSTSSMDSDPKAMDQTGQPSAIAAAATSKAALKVPNSLEEYLAPYAHLVALQTHPNPSRSDRVLVAAKDFAPGEVLFSEPALLDSAHGIAQEFQPVPMDECFIAHDYQRMLFEYIANQVYSPDSPNTTLLHLATRSLSTDGMTSDLAAKINADRLADYAAGIKVFREKVKKRLSRRAVKMVGPFPTQDSLLQLLYMIETNVHAEELPEAHPLAASSRRQSDDADDEKEEDHCALGLVASMPDHSCVPNAQVCFFPRLTGPKRYTPPASDDEDADIPEHTHLLFTALRPIQAGEPIAIAYQENSCLPTHSRRMQLVRRGFACNCPMCAGQVPDFARAVACVHCGGVGVPSSVPVSPQDVEVVDDGLEDEYGDPIVDIQFPPASASSASDIHCASCSTLLATPAQLDLAQDRLLTDPEIRMQALTRVLDVFSHHIPSPTASEGLCARSLAHVITSDCAKDPELAALLTVDGVTPLSAAHWLVYDAVRRVLYFDSDALDRDMHLPAVMYLVASNYATIALATGGAPGGVGGDEEEDRKWTRTIAWNGDVLHNLKWLMKTARARGHVALAQWAADRGVEASEVMGVAGKTSGVEDEFKGVFSRPRESIVFT